MGTRLLLILLVLLAGCGPVSTAPQGKVARPFSLPGLDGRKHGLAEYTGKVVILNFWATWCIPCRAEVPDLEHEYRVHAGELVVLGVDYQEPPSDVQSFVKEIGLTYPILMDASGTVHDAYGVGGLPQTFVLDRAGRVVVSRVGIASRDRLEQEFRKASSG